MLETLLTVLVGLILAICAAWATQHVLGTPIGWLRAVILVAIVYALTLPVARAAMAATSVRTPDGQWEVSTPLGVVFIAVALGWQFALAVTVIMLSELFWPSGRGLHPIRGIRGMIDSRKRLQRYAQTLRIASKHGLSLYGNRNGGDDNLPDALVAAINEAGPTFIKVGQVLSTRDDILPVEITRALGSLQSQTVPMPWPDAKAAIEAELSRPIDQVFEWVDETPLAAASLAQVHKARLRPTDDGVAGANVVIKVQRPDVRRSVQTDSDIILRLAREAERRAAWARAYQLSALATEFARSLADELDYRIELANTELLRDVMAKSSVPTIHVPDVYPDLCTERMMVQELVEGVPFSELHGALPEAMVDAPPRTITESRDVDLGALDAHVTVTHDQPFPTATQIADSLVDAIFEQIAVRGVFHADLHPGNIILRPDGEITLIDFGSVGVLERSMRRVLTALMAAINAEDDIALTDLLLMVAGDSADNPNLNKAALQHDIGVILTRMNAQQSNVGIFSEVFGVLQHHQLAIPPALLLVFRTIGSLEGSLRELDPDYDMVDRALTRTPHFARLALDPKAALTDARLQLQLVTEQLRRLPRRIETIGSRLENGTFGVSLRMFRDPLERNWVASLMGQLTTAIIGVVLVIAAVVLVVSTGGPKLTPDVALYPFLGAVLGLGGVLLVLRSLRTSLTRSGTAP